ncbi:MAG: carotenoid 1,2-hydratase [Beijerinckiaceae bacterium]|jgi:carotenoid 1,2-hydratase|nr:carotenoid 1,2-hydratase [Beijerinckiaceae bacterium]
MAHCAINVALYGPGARRWAMTERGAAAVERAPGLFRVGPSALEERGEDLIIRISERGMPIPRAVRGEIRIRPEARGDTSYLLNPHGQHIWRPLSPRCHVELAFEEPALRWQGTGYVDHNRGSMPLEAGFIDWTWCRGDTETGSLVGYSGRHQDGTPFSLGLAHDADGTAHHFPLPASQKLPGTFWRVPREVPADAGMRPEVQATLEDTPFYSRSVIRTQLAGHSVTMMHESLSLTRFANPVVQAMLPFRMPRRG